MLIVPDRLIDSLIDIQIGIPSPSHQLAPYLAYEQSWTTNLATSNRKFSILLAFKPSPTSYTLSRSNPLEGSSTV